MKKPELTELERIKMENFALRILFMQQQLQQVQVERANLVLQIEANHPGCEWREPYGLVLKEEAQQVEIEEQEFKIA